MTSRITTLAFAFAVLTTASITVGASSRESSAAIASAQVIQLERVVIVGKRLTQEQR